MYSNSPRFLWTAVHVILCLSSFFSILCFLFLFLLHPQGRRECQEKWKKIRENETKNENGMNYYRTQKWENLRLLGSPLHGLLNFVHYNRRWNLDVLYCILNCRYLDVVTLPTFDLQIDTRQHSHLFEKKTGCMTYLWIADGLDVVGREAWARAEYCGHPLLQGRAHCNRRYSSISKLNIRW